jgi:hypothetical protein
MNVGDFKLEFFITLKLSHASLLTVDTLDSNILYNLLNSNIQV